MKSGNSPKSKVNANEDEIDVKRYLSLFINNWYWFAISLFFTVSIAFGINRYSDKIYTVSSTLLIKDDRLASFAGTTANVIPGGDIFRNQQNLKNEVGILKSFSLNYKTIKKLPDFDVIYMGVGRRGIVEAKLYNNCPFKVVYDSINPKIHRKRIDIEIISEDKYILRLNDANNYNEELSFGEVFSEFGFSFYLTRRFPDREVFSDNRSNKYYFWFSDTESIAREYRNRLSVAPIENEASLVILSLSGSNPDQDADYLNTLMETYILYGLEIKNETADKTISFIDSQLRIISDSLSLAEENLENFRTKNNFTDLGREGSLIQDKLGRYENERTALELQMQYYNYLSEYLSLGNPDGRIISPSVMGITDQVLIKLVNELSFYQQEKDKIAFNLTGDQPVFNLLSKQARETREALKENVRNGINGLKLSIAESDKKIREIEKEMSKLPSTERRLINIQRKFDLNNTVYTYLLEKRSESGIAKASNVSDNRIIDRATYFNSNLIEPKPDRNYMLAIVLGFLLPGALLITIDFLNDKIIDKKDIERRTSVPVLGFIGHKEGTNEIAVIENQGSVMSESFRSVRTAIKFFIKENNSAVIAISSTISSEGKTFISVNLAAITAMLGKKVLLIGLDLRKPRINKIFNHENSEGMSNYLSGNCSYSNVIQSTNVKNLYYAPSGQIPPNPAELIGREKMKEFITEARKEFDYIIIDTPPVAIVTDALIISDQVDINIFIVRQRYSSCRTLDLIEELNQQGEMKNMAILINDIHIQGFYGYGVRYGSISGSGYKYGYNLYGKDRYKKYGQVDQTNGYYSEN